MDVEEAVKMVVSLGVVVPTWPRPGMEEAAEPLGDANRPKKPAVAKDWPRS